jgi:hypothetical protein
MRPGEFRLALPVHTLTFEATYQQAKPGNEAACVRSCGWVEHRVPDGSLCGEHDLVCAGPGLAEF